MQSLVVFMEPSANADNVSPKTGNMCLNRFCVDEDASFELSGVHYLAESSEILEGIFNEELKIDVHVDNNRFAKGKE